MDVNTRSARDLKTELPAFGEFLWWGKLPVRDVVPTACSRVATYAAHAGLTSSLRIHFVRNQDGCATLQVPIVAEWGSSMDSALDPEQAEL